MERCSCLFTIDLLFKLIIFNEQFTAQCTSTPGAEGPHPAALLLVGQVEFSHRDYTMRCCASASAEANSLCSEQPQSRTRISFGCGCRSTSTLFGTFNLFVLIFYHCTIAGTHWADTNKQSILFSTRNHMQAWWLTRPN
jgi:hypothetical protein